MSTPVIYPTTYHRMIERAKDGDPVAIGHLRKFMADTSAEIPLEYLIQISELMLSLRTKELQRLGRWN